MAVSRSNAGLRHMLGNLPPADALMEQLYRHCHKALMAAIAASDEAVAWLLPFHPAVIAHSLMGLVSEDVSIRDLSAPYLEEARVRLETLEQQKRKVGRPLKAQQQELAVAQLAFESIRDFEIAFEAAWKRRTNAVMFFWTDTTHRIVRATIGDADHGGVAVGIGGVFNHGMVARGEPSRATEALNGPFIGVSTPEDALALQTVAVVRVKIEGLPPERGYLWCGAISGGAATVRALTRRPVLFVADAPVDRALVAEVQQLANLDVFLTADGTSPAAWLSGLGPRAWDALTTAFYGRRLVQRPFKNVRRDIDGLREQEGKPLKKFLVERWASEQIVTDLREKGVLYFDGATPYFLLHSTHELIPVDLDRDDWKTLAGKYGIASSDALARPLAIQAYAAGLKEGVRCETYPFAHYDAERNTLYLFDLNKTVYRIRADAIDTVPNGTDGALFVKNPKWSPFELMLERSVLPSAEKALLDGMQFTSTELAQVDLRHLFMLYVMGMFFPELFPTRPILAMIGPKGSGKTSILQRLGMLLFGPSFHVSDLTDDPRDLDAALTSEFLVVADNADRDIKWLPDKLATVATGGKIQRRAYYTTNQLVNFPLKAWLAITSRTPHFRREDVADRLLPLHVARFRAFSAAGGLNADLARHRNDLMTSLARELQKVVGTLKATQGGSIKTTFRMADFAEFAIRVSSALGYHDDVETLLSRLSRSQMSFSMAEEPLFEALESWLENPGNQGREVSTGSLYSELWEHAGQRMPTMPFPYKSSQEFGKKLADFQSTLEDLYRMQRRDGHAGVVYMRFHTGGARGVA